MYYCLLTKDLFSNVYFHYYKRLIIYSVIPPPQFSCRLDDQNEPGGEQEENLSWGQAAKQIADREKWRCLVSALCASRYTED